jgi:glycosyltransferase involved in cell wall biosynthesis
MLWWLKQMHKLHERSEPLVSIITVVFNGERYLEETIKSVINQTYKNIEYIIIDGGSTDNTLNIIKKYEDKIDYWISEKDKGIYDAINKGIKLSRGELIGIINADDYYEIDVLEKVVSIYTKDSEVIYGDLRFIESESINFIAKAPIKLEGMLKRMVIFHPSTFVTKEVYLKYGMYKDTFKIAADYEFLLRLYCNKIKFFKVDGVFANFRDGGISSSFTWTNLKENIRARKENRISSIIFKELLVFIYFRLKGLFG